MKICLIDNKDSFTYNIADLILKCSASHSQIMDSSSLDLNEIEKFDRIILSPGPGLPNDFPLMKQLLAKYAGHIPILGVCLGHQAVCEYYGATLYNKEHVIHGQADTIRVDNNSSLFSGLPLEFNVGLYHSWNVEKDSLPSELKVTATLSSGSLMAVQHRSLPVYGVQFHPESFITEHGSQIMKNFIEAGYVR